MVEFQELPDSEPEMEEQYVDENFEIQTRTKDETQIELEKEQATEDAINIEIDRENETPQEFRKKLRAGNGKLKPTSGLCPGYQQAGIQINILLSNILRNNYC